MLIIYRSGAAQRHHNKSRHRILPRRFRSHSPILWSLSYRFIKAARQLSRASSWCSCSSRISVREVKGHFLGSSLYRTKSLVRTILAKGVARTSAIHEITLPKAKTYVKTFLKTVGFVNISKVHKFSFLFKYNKGHLQKVIVKKVLSEFTEFVYGYHGLHGLL